MALTITYTFVVDTPAEAAKVNANFTAVKNFVDALQAGTNFAAGAIGTAALADGSVTSAKLAASALASAQGAQFVLADAIFG